MITDTLVSMNLFNNETNQTINKIPLLYYWNGEGRLVYNIIHDKSFIEKYLDNINFNLYKNLYLGFFYFKYDEEDNELYTEDIVKISDHIDLSEFNSKNMINEILVLHLFDLYSISMKSKYNDVQVFNEDIIIDIYTKIKTKYKDKLNKNTFINWIRKEILEKDKVNNYNTDYIINYLSNILINEE